VTDRQEDRGRSVQQQTESLALQERFNFKIYQYTEYLTNYNATKPTNCDMLHELDG